MNEQELVVVELLASAWNAFLELKEEHPQDRIEFCHAIHQAQYLVMSRPTRRVLNADYAPKGQE